MYGNINFINILKNILSYSHSICMLQTSKTIQQFTEVIIKPKNMLHHSERNHSSARTI